MTYETSESTRDVEAVEQTHDQLATEHGRDNVLVMESSEGEIVALIGDEMGFVEPDEIQIHTQKAKNGELDQAVPAVIVTEPVYPDLDANTSRWVTCKLQWDDQDEVFVNKEAEDGWEIDDEAEADSTYTVEGSEEEYSCLSDAMHAALEEANYGIAEPKVVIRPSENETPEWGSHA
jgi:hypothetical protein